MFSLEFWLRNSLDSSVTQYTVKNLAFSDFYIGRRRDEKNLLVIRKFAEGNILINNPDDFDALSDYFFFIQDARFYIDEGTLTSYECQIKFSNPDYTTKNVDLELTFLDDYSRMFEGAEFGTWGVNQQPTISKLYSVTELDTAPEQTFVDGSQYMYDAEITGSELWGTETIDIETTKDVYVSDTFKINTGGDSFGGGELTIDMLLPNTEYIDQYYKPTFIKWENSAGIVTNKYFQDVTVTYEREFRYFEETETVPDEWIPVTGTRIKNDFTYNKYVRKLYGNQTYLSGEQVYFIRDEYPGGSDYISAEFRAYNTELQKSYNFFNVNDLLEGLSKKQHQVETYSSIISNDMYTCLMKNYNELNQVGANQFKFESFIDYYRDIEKIYYEYGNYRASFKSLSFDTKLLDIDNYRNTNFYALEKVNLTELPKVIDFKSDAWQLDFRSQKVSFYGNNILKDQITLPISTNLESTSNSKDEYILIDTQEVSHDQIYERGIYNSVINGTEAVLRTPDGKFVSWSTGFLDLSTFIDIDLFSNRIYTQGSGTMNVSFGVIIYSGSVRIRVGNLDQTYSASTTVNTNVNVTDDIEYFRITFNSGASSYNGFVYNISVKPITKVPTASTAVISGRSLKNANLSLANSIVNKMPLMSYKQGYLQDYGTIDVDVKYSKGINFVIPLDFDIFGYDMNDYCELNGEKYIIFEEKRQILDEYTINEYTNLKCRSNEVY